MPQHLCHNLETCSVVGSPMSNLTLSCQDTREETIKIHEKCTILCFATASDKKTQEKSTARCFATAPERKCRRKVRLDHCRQLNGMSWLATCLFVFSLSQTTWLKVTHPIPHCNHYNHCRMATYFLTRSLTNNLAEGHSPLKSL